MNIRQADATFWAKYDDGDIPLIMDSDEKIHFVIKRTESTSDKGSFPKNVLILVKHPSGMPEINCMGVNGVATRAIGDYWEVKFRPSDKDTFIFAVFHKNSLEVLGR